MRLCYIHVWCLEVLKLTALNCPIFPSLKLGCILTQATSLLGMSLNRSSNPFEQVFIESWASYVFLCAVPIQSSHYNQAASSTTTLVTLRGRLVAKSPSGVLPWPLCSIWQIWSCSSSVAPRFSVVGDSVQRPSLPTAVLGSLSKDLLLLSLCTTRWVSSSSPLPLLFVYMLATPAMNR